MTAFFGIVTAVGLLWLGVESAAKYNSVAPSMYRTSQHSDGEAGR